MELEDDKSFVTRLLVELDADHLEASDAAKQGRCLRIDSRSMVGCPKREVLGFPPSF
jgi:hypothetical protein